MNSAQYCAVLEEEMKPAIHSKHRRMVTSGFGLHRDNAQPHTAAAATIEIIQKLKFKLLSHPAYSP